MTLLFVDGFEAGDFAVKWDAASGSSSTTTRFSTGRSWSTSSGAIIAKDFVAASQITVGFATMFNSGTYPYCTLYGDSAATAHLTVTRNNITGQLELRRGGSGGTLLASGSTNLLVNVWYFIEVQATIADAGGTAQVRLNGITTPEINYTGDTKNAGTATTIDRVLLGSAIGTYTLWYDDVYILNSAGATNNTFLGDVRVHTIIPTGNGTDSGLTGSDGDSTNNYLLVDDLPWSSTDYTGSPTSGTRDTYTMADLPAGATTVFGVQNNVVAAKSDATAASTKTALRTGGSLYYGASHGLATSYINYRDLYDVNPNTATAWTVSDINGLEAGMEVV